jgi:hypothetical protein
MEHEYFGTLDVTSGVNWDGHVHMNGRSVPVDMTSDFPPSPGQLDAAASVLRHASRFDATARAAITVDRADDGAVTLYIDHHLSVLPPDALSAALGTTNPAAISRTQFLERMFLRGIGLYPDSPRSLAVFDYTLEGRVTDYVLCVSFDAAGAVTSVEMES